MKPGAVLRWNNFPYPKYGGEIKARWFIYLGDMGLFLAPIFAHLCTTTTSLEDFESGGRRVTHRFFSIKKKQYPFFEEDCILDFDEEPYAIKKDSLEENANIETKGQLDQETIKIIYRGILQSKYYPRKIILDIHASLNQIGITGLTKP